MNTLERLRRMTQLATTLLETARDQGVQIPNEKGIQAEISLAIMETRREIPADFIAPMPRLVMVDV